MRIANLTILLALCLASCTHGPELKPAPSASLPRGEDNAAIASLAGVRVTVDGDTWYGEPRELDTVVPLQVTIENRAGRPLRLRYREMALVGPLGSRFAALPPLSIDGAAMVRSPFEDYDSPEEGIGGAGLDPMPLEGPLDPEFDYDGYYVSPTYGFFWARPSPWAGPFVADPYYYDTWYSRWPVELPTEDMVAKALPEGVLSHGGRVSGFVYFQDVPESMDRVNFQLELVDAETGMSFGTVRIPFLTEDA